MPTVLRWNGYRFFFYSNENDEPPHVHIKKGDAQAKVWLELVGFAYCYQFSRREQRVILDKILEERDNLLEAWENYFDD